MLEFDEREDKRNSATKGTPEEQMAKYTQKWLELWKKCIINGRDLDENTISGISSPGAIPQQKWKEYLEGKIGTEDMYEVEAVLQMMEEIAINGDTGKALTIFDELCISATELDRIAEDVSMYMPIIPQQAPDYDKRMESRVEFEVRANEKAHLERTVISRKDESWLTKRNNLSEFDEREDKRNSATKGTHEEQMAKYTQKWLELWKKSIINGRDLDENTISGISSPGALPQQKWKEYLEEKIGTEDMYEVEAVLQMMEEIAINGDTDKALTIFDELCISETDLDRIAKDVSMYMPIIPQQAPDYDKRIESRVEFEVRANEKAHLERTFINREQFSKINIKSAVINSMTNTTLVPDDESIARDALANLRNPKENGERDYE